MIEYDGQDEYTEILHPKNGEDDLSALARYASYMDSMVYRNALPSNPT